MATQTHTLRHGVTLQYPMHAHDEACHSSNREECQSMHQQSQAGVAVVIVFSRYSPTRWADILSAHPQAQLFPLGESTRTWDSPEVRLHSPMDRARKTSTQDRRTKTTHKQNCIPSGIYIFGADTAYAVITTRREVPRRCPSA